MDAFETIAATTPADRRRTYAGMDLLSGALKNNSASIFLKLKSWMSAPMQPSRRKPSRGDHAAGRRGNRDARFILFNPPPIEGISLIGGFEGFIQNRGDATAAAGAVIAAFQEAAKPARDRRMDTTFRVETPQFKVKPDIEKAYALG